MNAPTNEPAGEEWFGGSDSADVPAVGGSSPAAARTAADPNNAVANAAAGMLGGVLMDKVPMLGTAVNKLTSTLNISENMKQLTSLTCRPPRRERERQRKTEFVLYFVSLHDVTELSGAAPGLHGGDVRGLETKQSVR
jgi:hypothetical protein